MDSTSSPTETQPEVLPPPTPKEVSSPEKSKREILKSAGTAVKENVHKLSENIKNLFGGPEHEPEPEPPSTTEIAKIDKNSKTESDVLKPKEGDIEASENSSKVTDKAEPTVTVVSETSTSPADLEAIVESQKQQILLQTTQIKELTGTVDKLKTQLTELTEVKIKLDILSHEYNRLKEEIQTISKAFNGMKNEKKEKMERFLNLEAASDGGGGGGKGGRAKRDTGVKVDPSSPVEDVVVVKKTTYITGDKDDEDTPVKTDTDSPVSQPKADSESENKIKSQASDGKESESGAKNGTTTEAEAETINKSEIPEPKPKLETKTELKDKAEKSEAEQTDPKISEPEKTKSESETKLEAA